MSGNRRAIVIAVIAFLVLLAGGCGAVAITSPETLGFGGGGDRGSGSAGDAGGAAGAEDEGGEAGDAAEEAADEEKLPLAEARLDGVWRFVYRRTSYSGFLPRFAPPARIQRSWTFRPECPEGACPVRGTSGGSGRTTSFEPRGRGYRGVNVTPVDCVDSDTGEIVEAGGARQRQVFTFRLAGAAEQDGVWRANRLTGRLVGRIRGCSEGPASFTYTFTGRLVRAPSGGGGGG